MDIFLQVVGAALLAGFVIPTKSGPFNLFKNLRKLGKPFTCELCSAYWGGMLYGTCLAWWVPNYIGFALTGAGWALALYQLSGYHFVTADDLEEYEGA